jgi:hypothetical protein
MSTNAVNMDPEGMFSDKKHPFPEPACSKGGVLHERPVLIMLIRFVFQNISGLALQCLANGLQC